MNAIRKLLPISLLLFITVISAARGQNVVVAQGTSLKFDGTISLVIQGGDLINAGSYLMAPAATTVFSNSNTVKLAGVAALTNLIKRGTGELFLLNDVQISGELTFMDGIVNSGTNVVTLTSTATVIGEEEGSHLVGVIDTEEPVGTGSADFGGVGVVLSTGIDDLGAVSADYTNGDGSAVSVGGYTSIERVWNISSTNPPTNGRTLTLSWVPDDDNGLDISSVAIWKSTDAGTTWRILGALHDASTSHSISFVDYSFGMYTIGNAGFVCPEDMVVTTDPSSCKAVVSYVPPASEQLLGTLTYNPPNPGTFEVGVHTVNLLTSTGHSCSFNVTVRDERPPDPLAQNVTVALDASGAAGITAAQIDNGSTDDCGIASMTVSPDNFTCADIGTNSVSFTVTDIYGNAATASAVVTVLDNLAPTVRTQNLTIALDASGTTTITANDVDDGTSDACNALTLSVAPNTFTCADIGPNTVTFTATDAYNNTSICTATVTVEGAIPSPTITVDPSPTVADHAEETIYLGFGPQTVTLIASGNPGDSYSWSPTDHLSDPNIAKPVFSVDADGSYSYTVTVTNQYGCTGTASVTLYVLDWRCSNNENNVKIMMCHQGKTICVSESAVSAHLNLGDYIGCCQVSKNRAGVPNTLSLSQNYPNPFNPSTVIEYRIPENGDVQLRVFDLFGRELHRLVDEIKQAGTYHVSFDGSTLPSGVYVYRLESNGHAISRTMTLLK